ncbi:MAG: hypothetical protein LBP62_06025 [Clostridiales bacterium]|nr:hypothetical protein [Clostridiales bacterium]
MGVKEYFINAEHPQKRSKYHPLPKEERTRNREISTVRNAIEHINARLKVFKILSYPYRNHRKKHAIRNNLTAALVNLNLN